MSIATEYNGWSHLGQHWQKLTTSPSTVPAGGQPLLPVPSLRPRGKSLSEWVTSVRCAFVGRSIGALSLVTQLRCADKHTERTAGSFEHKLLRCRFRQSRPTRGDEWMHGECFTYKLIQSELPGHYIWLFSFDIGGRCSEYWQHLLMTFATIDSSAFVIHCLAYWHTHNMCYHGDVLSILFFRWVCLTPSYDPPSLSIVDITGVNCQQTRVFWQVFLGRTRTHKTSPVPLDSAACHLTILTNHWRCAFPTMSYLGISKLSPYKWM